MNIKLEHANLQVNDFGKMLEFIKTAFPTFTVRHDSGSNDPERWMHIGNEETYLAINQATKDALVPTVPYSGRPGFNHLGYVVDDVMALQQRLLKAGFKETTYENHHFARKRIYFNDAEGNDWEFIEYFSEQPHLQNDYSDL